MQDAVYYAIGDIHGEYERMLTLHREIEAFHREFHASDPKILIHLGDYVDRGADSARVIDALISMQRTDSDKVICLKGNHEVMMIDAVSKGEGYEWWCRHGGNETMQSYQNYSDGRVPEAHLTWMDALPSWLHVPERKLVFVHASIDPAAFPETDERKRLWGRSRRFFESELWENPATQGYCIIHGHTPTRDSKPDMTSDRRRINVDTGAVYGGSLTAVALAPGLPPRFIST